MADLRRLIYFEYLKIGDRSQLAALFIDEWVAAKLGEFEFPLITKDHFSPQLLVGELLRVLKENKLDGTPSREFFSVNDGYGVEIVIKDHHEKVQW